MKTLKYRDGLAAAGLTIAVLAVVLVGWQLLASASFDRVKYLPSPTDVVSALSDLVRGEVWREAVKHTLTASAIASAIAIVSGAVVGLAIGLFRAGDKFYMASLDFLRTIPAIILMPVIILIWGPTMEAEIIVTTWVAFWPMMINTIGGVRQVPERLNEVAQIFAFSKINWVVRIVVPASLREMIVGARLAIVNALIVAITAEMLFSGAGLGWEIWLSQQALRSADMWAFAITCCLLGYLLNVLLMRATSILFPGGDERR